MYDAKQKLAFVKVWTTHCLDVGTLRRARTLPFLCERRGGQNRGESCSRQTNQQANLKKQVISFCCHGWRSGYQLHSKNPTTRKLGDSYAVVSPLLPGDKAILTDSSGLSEDGVFRGLPIAP